MDKTEVKRIVGIEGYISLEEGLFLYSLANTLKKSAVIVEIGSWKGLSAVWLASGLRDGMAGRVIAVDHGIGDPEAGLQETAEIFSENIKKANVSEMITPIFKKSEEAISGWSSPINMLFIDGSHDYESVRRDFLWEKYLADGGWLVMHDVINPAEGPARVFLGKVLRSNNFENFGTVDSILFAQKKKVLSRCSFRKTLLIIFLKSHLILTKIYKKLPKRGLRKKIVRVLMKNILRNLIAKTANFQISSFNKLKAELT